MSARLQQASIASHSPLHLALIVVSYGNYHLARARALTRTEGIETSFIELVATVNQSPWWSGEREFDRPMIRISDSSYEESPMRDMSRKVVGVLSDIQPDVVIIAGYKDPPMRSAAQWARRNSRGVVLLSETTEWDFKRRWWLETVKRVWIRRHVDTAVVGGESHRSYAVKLGVDPDRIWDRYDVVDNNFFSGRCDALRAQGATARIHAGLPENYFLYVGRLAPEKNLERLLRAYGTYRRAHSQPWSLVIVGEGPQRERLFQVGCEERLHGVVWAGSKRGDELPAYYAFAGCFILPSSLEPWGLVVNEAMASGLPVLVSNRCGSASELVRHGVNGFIFDPADVDEIGNLMSQIASRTGEQRYAMAQASRRLISGWSPEQWAIQIACAARAAARRRARPAQSLQYAHSRG
jgi:1,2-diacylglycerol 3-alpha-glucosyltransferase